MVESNLWLMRGIMLVRRFSIIAASVAALSITSANAQVKGSQCVDLAKAIVTQETTSITENQLTALTHYAYCEASSQSSNATLDVAYKAFNLGAGYSDTEKKVLCEKSRKELGISNFDYKTGSDFFSQSLPTIDKCLIAASAF